MLNGGDSLMTVNVPKLSKDLERKEAVDWSSKAFAVKVKDMGTTCASSWAFAATNAQNYAHSIYLNDNKQYDFSVQQLIDCTYKWHNGCEHGWPGDGLTYLTSKNSCEDQDYPYTGESQECKYSTDTCKEHIVNSYWQI